MIITRRGLLGGLLAAPAIVAADRLMPVRLWKPEGTRFLIHNSWGKDWEMRGNPNSTLFVSRDNGATWSPLRVGDSIWDSDMLQMHAGGGGGGVDYIHASHAITIGGVR